MSDDPGRTPHRPARFVERYERRRSARRDGAVHRLTRLTRIVIGSLLIVAAVAIGWLPGPGFVPLAVAGGLLLAGEVRWVADRLDPIEHHLRRYFPLRRRVAWTLTLLGCIVVVLAAFAAFQWRDRDPQSESSPPVAARGIGIGTRPEAGSYEFQGAGFERADVGPIIARELPTRLPVLVRHNRGCQWSAEYTYSSSRTLIEDMCSADDGVIQLRTTANIRIGPLDETQRIDCPSARAFRVRMRPPPNQSWTFTCTTDATTVSIRASAASHHGCDQARAAISMRMDFDGQRNGTATYGYLLDEGGLPIAFASKVHVKTKVGILPVVYESAERYRRVGMRPACSITSDGRVGDD